VTDALAVGPEQLQARWSTLPEPVRRYLWFAVADRAPSIASARLEHDGFFRIKPDQRWMKIKGRQDFTVATPGFVWRARVWPLPLAWIDARDSLTDGHGQMLVKLMSVVPLANARGPEIDQGSRLRWLAEGAWFPYAFVTDSVVWKPIDHRSARAILRCEGLPVEATLDVDDQGKLLQLRASRYRDIGGGKAVLTPWRGQYAHYGQFGNFRVPTSVEVSWELPDGVFTYARFRVAHLAFA